MNLEEKRAAKLAAARSLAEAAKSAGRDLSQTEHTHIENYLAEVDAIDAQLVAEKKSADLMAKLNGTTVGVGDDDEPVYTTAARPTSTWAKSIVTTMTATARQFGVKALLAGEVSTPAAVPVVPLPEVPARILDLVTREGLDATNTYAYLRQTVRDENPAVVADGALKPTSTYTFEEIEDRCRVVAHLSEPFPLRYLADHAELGGVLDGEMKQALMLELERQLVAGDGAGENFRGILTTNGVLDVPFTADVLTTARTARSVLEAKGENPTAWVLHPTDAANIEMMREDAAGGFLFGGSLDVVFGSGITRLTSHALTPGTAILADWSTVRMKVRETEHTLAATQAGDLFDKNQVKLRCEGRYGLVLSRPQALAVVHLAAA